MSADGRLSDMREVGGEKIYYPVSDNSEKITLMRENTIAVGYFGEPAVFDNKTVTTMLDMLDERGIRKRDSVRMVAEKVRETFCFRYNLFGLTFFVARSEEHTSELQSRGHLVCRLLLERKK